MMNLRNNKYFVFKFSPLTPLEGKKNIFCRKKNPFHTTNPNHIQTRAAGQPSNTYSSATSRGNESCLPKVLKIKDKALALP